MTAPTIKGWCPGAHRPMMSGDGLVVRVRPRVARLTADQVLGLCQAALAHGNGTIDLTNRANLQLRGVSEDAHEPLLCDLAALDLLDSAPGIEARRNVLVQPVYHDGDLTCRLTLELLDRLSDLPTLPAKFGFAIDTGSARILADCSADIRLESGPQGLIVRADGAATGRIVHETEAVDRLVELAGWFAARQTTETRRMARLIRDTALPEHWQGAQPSPVAAEPIAPGAHGMGAVYGAPFGQIQANALAGLMTSTGAKALRVTPWRLFLLEGGAPIPDDAFVFEPDDRLLTTDACAGAPFCPQAQVETRAVARALAPRLTGSLHVSGCAKGCARQSPASVTLVGRNGRFDLVKHGRAGDEPAMRDLNTDDLMTLTDLT